MTDNSSSDHDLEQELEQDGAVAVAEEHELAEPKMFKVILLNDDYTTMDFVVRVLEIIFKKSPSEAVGIMMNIHKMGKGVCGIYPRQIAETKISMVHAHAKSEAHPLKCVMEEI